MCIHGGASFLANNDKNIKILSDEIKQKFSLVNIAPKQALN